MDIFNSSFGVVSVLKLEQPWISLSMDEHHGFSKKSIPVWELTVAKVIILVWNLTNSTVQRLKSNVMGLFYQQRLDVEAFPPGSFKISNSEL